MGIIGGRLGYSILRSIAPRETVVNDNEIENADLKDTKLNQFFGKSFFDETTGKTVIDFGCGNGKQAVEIALNGAKKVIGIDIEEQRLEQAEKLAGKFHVAERCKFVAQTNEKADIIISKDAFEHFHDPVAVLHQMRNLLKASGYIFAAFGPTWYHPFGGHLFSVFPWAHFLFTEEALIEWRSDFKSDGATRFCEVEGGLSQLTIRRFETVVNEAGFRFLLFETVPIKGLRFLRNSLLREFGSSIVRCKLVPKT